MIYSVLRQVVNLNPDAVDASEIDIMIGDQSCPVESIKGKVIRCDIPAKPSGKTMKACK